MRNPTPAEMGIDSSGDYQNADGEVSANEYEQKIREMQRHLRDRVRTGGHPQTSTEEGEAGQRNVMMSGEADPE